MRRGLGGGAPRSATPDCLDDDTIAALADGALDPAARARALPHLSACGRCRAAVASVAAALDDPAVARAARAVERPGGRRVLWRVGLPAAVAAAAMLLIFRPQGDEAPGPHRAPTITTVPAPAPLAPVGPVAAAPVLRWSPVDGADRYRVTLFDADGVVRYETELVQTSVVLPDSVELVSGRRYLWKVEARTGFDRWVGSELVEFVLAGTRP
jgi:hypothetical protein